VNASVLVAVIATAVSVFTAVLTYRVSTKANASDARKVDLEEHRDALDRLKRVIDEQDKHIERVRAQADRVQEQLAREQDVSFALRNEIRALQGQVDELIRSRVRLEDRLDLIDPPSRRRRSGEDPPGPALP
jgi:peptidoglycan hydrolase CwlO-like protein